MKRIIICADDYGQNRAISQGIIALLSKNRLSAVSCLTTSPEWSQHAAWLAAFSNQVDIGLHFNLTEGDALSDVYRKCYAQRFFSLPKLLIRAWLRYLNISVIEAELSAQLDCFISAMGRLPDFIDGHQHIHQLPQVREALIGVYHSRFPKKKGYIRCVNDQVMLQDWVQGCGIKKTIIKYFSKKFEYCLAQHNIQHNNYFSGSYNFSRANHYAQMFPGFLKAVGDQGLIMCHPGLECHDSSDPIVHARSWEYAYFSSDAYIADCQTNDVRVSRFFESQ